MRICSKATGGWGAVVMCLALAFQAAAQMDRFYVEVGDGTSWTFLETGEESQDGGPWESFGPFVLQWGYRSVDQTVFGHQANLGEYEGDELTGYFLKNNEDVFRLTDADPINDDWYEYYSDPKPFFSPLPLALGDTPLAAAGAWEGQWTTPTGLEQWTGGWTVEVTNLGVDTVTVPLGTFQATKFQVDETSNKRVDPLIRDSATRSSSTDYIWLVEGVGPVRITGEGIYESDWDGDGIYDETDRERWELRAISLTDQTIQVPQPTSQLPAYTSNGGSTQQDVADALVNVQNGLTASQFGNPNPDHGYGMLSGLIQPEAGSIETLVDALVADGAGPEQAFVQMVIEYDDTLLADYGIDETDLAPYWWDDQNDRWVLVGTTTDGLEGPGKLATTPAHKNLVGYYGIDTDANHVWLNVNHASVYGVLTPVPEPSTLGLLALAGLWPLTRRRHPQR